jgi:hypothetical protein
LVREAMMKALLSLTTLLVFPTPVAVANPQDSNLTIEQAAREYRIRVYERFRLTRDQYDSHRRVGDEVLRLWRITGEPADQSSEVVEWFRQATEATEVSSALPPLPSLKPRQVVEAASPTEEEAAAEPQAPMLDEETAKALEEAASLSPPAQTPEDLSSAPVPAATPAPAATQGSSGILGSMGRAVLRAVKHAD